MCWLEKSKAVVTECTSTPSRTGDIITGFPLFAITTIPTNKEFKNER